MSMSVRCGFLVLLATLLIPSSTLCRVFPSHYSFREDEVIYFENDTNVCTTYNDDADPVLPNVNTSQFVMCGEDIRLSDSDYGPQQYSDSDQDRFYIWKRADNSRLLFTFPSAVQLTYITLHYYSDSDANISLPMLTLYAVPDEWQIWQQIENTTTYLGSINSTQEEEDAGLRNVTLDIAGFNASQLLMYISPVTEHQQFFLSEVEFFNGLTSSDFITTTTFETDATTTPVDSEIVTTSFVVTQATTTERIPEIFSDDNIGFVRVVVAISFIGFLTLAVLVCAVAASVVLYTSRKKIEEMNYRTENVDELSGLNKPIVCHRNLAISLSAASDYAKDDSKPQMRVGHKGSVVDIKPVKARSSQLKGFPQCTAV